MIKLCPLTCISFSSPFQCYYCSNTLALINASRQLAKRCSKIFSPFFRSTTLSAAMSLPTTKDRHLKTLTSILHRSTQFRTFSYNKYSYIQTCVRVHVSFSGLQKKKKKEKKMCGTGLTNLCFEACHILHVHYFCEINMLVFSGPSNVWNKKKNCKKKKDNNENTYFNS